MEHIFTSFKNIYVNKQKTKNHKPSTSKSKSMNLQHPRTKVIKNLQYQRVSITTKCGRSSLIPIH